MTGRDRAAWSDPSARPTRRALVTGGAGFLGGHLVERLQGEGWEVTVLDIRPPVLPGDATWIEADVRDGAAMVRAASGSDVVFHLGAVVGVERLLEDPVAAIDVAVNGTRHALEAASTAGASLVHLSTSEVLGINPAVPWAEDADRVLGSALVDRWGYGAAKAAAEHVVLAGAPSRHVAATVIRPFNVYGPRQEPRFVVPLMIRAAMRGEPIEVHDHGTQTRCFTYIDDVIDAIVAAGDKPGVGPVLHIGSTEEVSIERLAHLIDDLVGGSRGVAFDRPADRWGNRYQDIDRRVPDPSLASTVLGWRATTPLADGLARTISWTRSAATWLDLPVA